MTFVCLHWISTEPCSIRVVRFRRNRRALDDARGCGVRVAIVTGRRFRDARPIALELGLDVPVIAHNGALTKHAETLETVAVLPLPLAAAHQAIKVGRAAGADPLVSDDHEGLGVLIYDHLSGDNLPLLQYVAWAQRIHGEASGARCARSVGRRVFGSRARSPGILWWLRKDEAT